MSGLKNIISKELTRVFKDRKLIFSMFILPAIVVIGIMYLTSTLIGNMENKVKTHISEVYVQEAPAKFKDLLDKNDMLNVHYIDANADIDALKDDIKAGKADLIIVFPDGFEAAVSDKEGKIVPEIKTFYNPSEEKSSQARTIVTSGELETYRQLLLTDRFGNTDKVGMFSVDISDPGDSEIVDEKRASGKALGTFIPYLVTMIIFAGAMGLGVDSIAGEKERGTLASLLLTPIRRVDIVMGKMISLGILSLLSAAIYVVAMLVSFPMLSKAGTNSMAGLSLSLSGTQIIALVVIVIGTVLLYVSIIGYVSVLARSIKEAQTYITPIYMLIIVAGLISMFTTDSNSLSTYAIPLVNIASALKGIFTNDISIVQIALTTVMTYGLTALLIGATAKAFKSEKIMFNS